MSVGTKSIGATTTVIVAKNTARSLLTLSNASDETIFLGFDEAAVQNSGIALKPLGQNNLKCIASQDVLLGLFHPLAEELLAHIRLKRRAVRSILFSPW